VIDWIEVGIVSFVVIFALLLAALVAGGVVDFTQDYRSYDAQVACQQKKLVAVRRTFSAKVTCVPLNTRQDTLTIAH
jgi:uncharacterized membrane protein